MNIADAERAATPRRNLALRNQQEFGGASQRATGACMVCSVLARAAAAAMLLGGVLTACSPAPQTPASSQHPLSDLQPAAAAATPAAVSPTTVQIEPENGTYRVPILINNALTLKFTIGSDASDVTIPADVMMTLVRTGKITKDDYIGERTYQLADGSTVPSSVFRIKSLKVGDRELHDVEASVTNINGDLLLGQSFLSRLTSWSMDNQRHVLVLYAPGAQPTAPPRAPVQIASATSRRPWTNT